MVQYCPHHATCPFYQNWMEKTGDTRTDVIVRETNEDGISGYNCFTLIALEDPVAEGGILMGDKLELRLSNPKQRSFECSHITQLNLLNVLYT